MTLRLVADENFDNDILHGVLRRLEDAAVGSGGPGAYNRQMTTPKFETDPTPGPAEMLVRIFTAADADRIEAALNGAGGAASTRRRSRSGTTHAAGP